MDFYGPVSHLRQSTILDLESPSNFQVKEKKILKSVHKQGSCKLDLCGPESHLR